MAFLKYFMVLVFYNAIPAIHTEFLCQTWMNGCICTSTVQKTYEIQCSMDDPKVVIEVKPDSKRAKIQCIKEINWDNQNLSSIEIEDLQYLEFLMCPLPTNSFSGIMNRLRINGTKELRFTYSGDFENVTLTSDYFKGVQRLEKLTLSNNNLRNIDEDAFEQLDTLTEVDLNSNKVQLTDGLFKHLTKLTYVDLAQNELTYIPSGLFKNLTDLKSLHLWSNKLTTLNNSVLFENLKNLEVLELSRNQLVEVLENTFSQLENLRKLSLSSNKLHYVPENLFMKNMLLEHVNMNRNPSLILPESLFANLTKLGSVWLSECKLIHLPDNLFHGSVNLENITLKMNEIEYLPENIFVDLVVLHHLDMSYNKIRDLPDEIFSTLKELKTLKLENNMLTSIRKQFFYNLKSVEMINLKNNNIKTIQMESFQGASSLKKIILANNHFDLPLSLFNQNVKLEEVDLSHNNITTITDEFLYTLTVLRKLDLSYNQIDYLDFNSVFTLSHDIELDLTYNNISTVNFDYAEAVVREQEKNDVIIQNRVVYLDGNPIDCDCQIYNFVRYFDRSIDPWVPTYVTIKADNLTCVSPSDFTGFPVNKLHPKIFVCPLHQLGIEANSPKNCTYGYRLWDNSLIVDCINGNLTEVPKLILPKKHVFSQMEVYLQRNFLISGPKRNMGYENVTKLSLSYNNISEISWVPPKIKILELDNNKISNFSGNTLSMLNTSSLTNITLGNNPWNCDCSVVNLNNFLVSHLASKKFDTNSIKCSGTGKLLVRLTTNDLCPTHTATVLGLGITICLVLLVIAILVALYFRYQQEIKVWLFAHNMCLWFVTEEEIDKDKSYDAFISYSHKDEEFVLNELIPILEKGPQPYKLCIHIRDWVAGEYISRQIATSVADSRRTLVILSPDFLKSEWGIMEFRTAHKQAIHEGRARVILILYGDIDMESDLDDELKAYIRTNTYVKWGDPWFWDKLRYALPHSRIKEGKKSQKNQNIVIALNEKLDVLNNDKLDLINGAPTTPNPGSTPPAMNIDPLLLKNNPLNFTPPAESGLNPLLITSNK